MGVGMGGKTIVMRGVCFMARRTSPIVQNYPRIQDEESKFHGYLDDSKLQQHYYKIPEETIRQLVIKAIDVANSKTSREILSIPDDATEEEIERIYVKEGKSLFSYFRRYCGDPASTAFDICNKHYEDICKQQFHNRTLQKERMNSGWRYQYLVKDCAIHSERFKSVSDIGAAEADFNATIAFIDSTIKALSLYVSVKNRTNTMGGQDWPKAIRALEKIASTDKNRTGSYCCVFGIAMDRGMRRIKIDQRTNQPHSVNTEVWKADFFWPFFSNYSYEEIMSFVLETLISMKEPEKVKALEIPGLLVETFGECCRKADLVNEDGLFDDSYKLVKFFCGK
jgi:hypothetical protein